MKIINFVTDLLDNDTEFQKYLNDIIDNCQLVYDEDIDTFNSYFEFLNIDYDQKLLKAISEESNQKKFKIKEISQRIFNERS